MVASGRKAQLHGHVDRHPGGPCLLPDGVRADVLAHHQQPLAPGRRLLGAGQADLGLDNRIASFRVIAGAPKSTRLETRCPGADVDPYVAMAAVIAAGMHGVDKGLELIAPPAAGTCQGARPIPRAGGSIASGRTPRPTGR
ncbi:MAG: hypothetical protein U1F56_15940 [Rubrivivax sp.]